MKRTEINNYIKEAAELMRDHGFFLPPFAYWTARDWAEKNGEYREIIDNMLGWDITDFGSGNFEKVGLLLFTLRNGNMKDKRYSKTYAEKLMVVGEGQVTPYHYHWSKMEDIINRGGGELIVRVYARSNSDALSDEDVTISSDGRSYVVPAGTEITVRRGESITLYPGQYHSFWGNPGHGKVLVGEVSMVNDDKADNRFLEKAGRFPQIEEDAEQEYLLCTDEKHDALSSR